MKHTVFIVGGTGFMGRALSTELRCRGHSVLAMARPGSEKKVAAGVTPITGDPLDRSTYAAHLKPHYVMVSLAGVSHPNPLKSDQFQKIDFICGRESVLAAKEAGISEIIYVSVVQPAPFMGAYAQARAAVEALIRNHGLNATILRVLYVIGPGRRWPLLLKPLYWLLESQSATRAIAQKMGFVSIEQAVNAMVAAIESPASGVRVWDVPAIRRHGA